MRVLADRYELVRFLGRGGMGEVWEGRDRVLKRRVAVKLLPSRNGDTSGADLFFREARTAGALNHPGVVTVHDLGRDPADGSLFLVMEFVEGRDLATVLRDDGPPPVKDAVRWAAEAAAALVRAHTAGIVHRDLKPANLMLTGDGTVKILDFGIARFMEATDRSSRVLGTVAYMPPERFDEQPGDARSDLYSLGCVLHELLTGRVPFEATGMVSMMNAHLRKAPTRPGEQRPGVPADLDALVLALLAKEPKDRPSTADEVRTRLRAITVPGVPPPIDPLPGSHAAPPDVPLRLVDTEPNPRIPPGDWDKPTEPRPHPPIRPKGRRLPWIAAGGVAVCAGLIAAVLTLTGGDDSGGRGTGAAKSPADGGTPRSVPRTFNTAALDDAAVDPAPLTGAALLPKTVTNQLGAVFTLASSDVQQTCSMPSMSREVSEQLTAPACTRALTALYTGPGARGDASPILASVQIFPFANSRQSENTGNELNQIVHHPHASGTSSFGMACPASGPAADLCRQAQGADVNSYISVQQRYVIVVTAMYADGRTQVDNWTSATPSAIADACGPAYYIATQK
ncbi:serine/threonine-protein kinase [Yinghuangia seranimata]|uniref:serine/threonine-protein kinase n=1 Tax=Yinghuangia seranimata TaxID=408067 RepID=UPI00248BBED0|nr:serine/threonine-protein kinase [Yinghuangia seranimata]MDI2130161.1 serine/threonine-protein kinase [Yinghuangia seranimata]